VEALYAFPLGSAFFVLAGIAAIVVARRRSRAWKRFVGASQVTQAQVLDLRTRHSRHDQGPIFVPVVRFPFLDGRMVETETMSGSRPAPARRGDVVMVRFDPADPTRVSLADGLATPAAGGCVLAGLGVGFVVLGLLLGLLSAFLLLVVTA